VAGTFQAGFLASFSGSPVCGVLQGFLRKTGCRTWRFDGEFVVKCVAKLVRLQSLFEIEK
jgi:hypothetical protein